MKLLKKGQVGGLQGFILSIVTVSIVLAVGLIVLSELETAAKVGGTTTGNATNCNKRNRKYNYKTSNSSNVDRNNYNCCISIYCIKFLHWEKPINVGV